MTAPNPKEALEECIAVLQLVEQPAIRDPDHREEVGALGDRIGFGALMSAASAEWRERLLQEGALVGGEFVAGPCRATVLEALAKARAALATKPDGERREEIARALAEKWPGDYMQGDDEGQREPNALAYETADTAIASGLMQDENSIRADEREKCAKIADREAEFWQDAESSSARIVAANIRSARNGGEG